MKRMNEKNVLSVMCTKMYKNEIKLSGIHAKRAGMFVANEWALIKMSKKFNLNQNCREFFNYVLQIWFEKCEN